MSTLGGVHTLDMSLCSGEVGGECTALGGVHTLELSQCSGVVVCNVREV